MPQAVDSISLVPGERAEVLVLPTTPGSYRLSTPSVGRGNVGMGRGGAVTSAAAGILTMVVSGDRSATAELPSLPKRQGNTGLATVDRTRELTFYAGDELLHRRP